MVIYVDANAFREGNGTKERPFRYINDAAQIARPGDEVLVAPGVYREYVNPANAGTQDARITYRSTEPLGAVITGAMAEEEAKALREHLERAGISYTTLLLLIALQEDMSSLAHNILLGYEHGEGWPSGT